MPIASYEIRVCTSCGLRYPLVEGHTFGTRCPICTGTTRKVLEQSIPAGGRSPLSGGETRRRTLAVLLDNVRSAWNAGSILRSADGFGFSHAYMCGITPAASHAAVAKTALGAEGSVPSSHHRDAVELVRQLRDEGWNVCALEEDARALEIRHLSGPGSPDEKILLIVGNEVTGVDPALLELSHTIVSIPMRGQKQSFNVAVAFAIAAYELTAPERFRRTTARPHRSTS